MFQCPLQSVATGQPFVDRSEVHRNSVADGPLQYLRLTPEGCVWLFGDLDVGATSCHYDAYSDTETIWQEYARIDRDLTRSLGAPIKLLSASTELQRLQRRKALSAMKGLCVT